jgi:hypothetical protein
MSKPETSAISVGLAGAGGATERSSSSASRISLTAGNLGVGSSHGV